MTVTAVVYLEISCVMGIIVSTSIKNRFHTSRSDAVSLDPLNRNDDEGTEVTVMMYQVSHHV